MKSSELTPRQICQLYQSGEPTGAIANKAGITSSGVRYHLRLNGVTLRARGAVPYRPRKVTAKPRKDRNISIGKVRDLYTVKRLSIREVAKAAGVSNFTARRDLRKAGVPIRPRGGQGTRGASILNIAVAKRHHAAIMVLVEAFGGKQV